MSKLRDRELECLTTGNSASDGMVKSLREVLGQLLDNVLVVRSIPGDLVQP